MKNKTPKNVNLVALNDTFIYDDSVVFALFLVENADIDFYNFKDDCFWKYSSEDGCFYYANPNNAKRKGWYKGRGLQSTYEGYLISQKSLK